MSDIKSSQDMSSQESAIASTNLNKECERLISSLADYWAKRINADKNDGRHSPERIYRLFSETIAAFDRYARNPYELVKDQSGMPIWGEDYFLNLLGYDGRLIHAKNNNDGETPEGVALVANKDTHVSYLLNAYRWNNEFVEQLNNMNEECDQETFWARKLITLCALVLRTKLSFDVQFTYSGERFIAASSAFNRKNKSSNKSVVTAVPFRHAETLSPIDSIRLIEKVNQQIVKIESASYSEGNPQSSRNNGNLIRIAVFGAFCDEPAERNGKYNIELFADKGYFLGEKNVHGEKTEYKVKITRFELKTLGLASAVYQEVPETENQADLIRGDIYDPEFLGETVSSKYDIICLLDMGCLYADTCRNLDFRKTSPYEEALNSIRSVEIQKSRYGIDGISARAYNNLYLSYLKWIEYAFYGKSHLFQFDARLFAVLNKSSKMIDKKCSVFTYFSRNRGDAIAQLKEYDNLCRYEYYFGRDIIVYDWSNNTVYNELYNGVRNDLITEGITKDKGQSLVVRIRFWKLLKSLDDFYYSKAFTTYLIENDIGEQSFESHSADIDFVAFLKDTYVLFDYSYAASSNKVLFSLQYSPQQESKVEKEDTPRYMVVSRMLLNAIVKLGFDHYCYEDCSSSLCRNVVLHTMLADAKTVEQLVLINMLTKRYLYSRYFDFEPSDNLSIDDNDNNDYEPTEKRIKQKVYAELYNAISSINAADYLRFDQAVDMLSDRGIIDDSDELLKHLGKVCEKLGYTECTLYKCTK